MRDRPDETLALLADLVAATDGRLRELAERIAGSIFVDAARRGPTWRRGVGKLQTLPYRPDGGDLDIDASLEAIIVGIRDGAPSAVDLERLRVRGWVVPGTAISLLVDRSGSMGGKPLATAALAAAAVASLAPSDYSVLAFGNDVVVAKSQLSLKSGASLVNDILALRGFGTTDLAGALTAAHEQLECSRAGRKVAVLLSDCRATVRGDAAGAAAMLDELVIAAPETDCDEARSFAVLVGARCVTVSGPSSVADVLTRAFERQH
jgi:Mg-chelatase subunit ChlD